MKKALVFDPYMDTLGGGERYVFSVAQTLVRAGFTTDLAWREPGITKEAGNRFGLHLNKISINPKAYELLSTKSNFWRKIALTRQYDLVFFLSDGSIPALCAKNNLLHLQMPLKNAANLGIADSLKLVAIDKIIYNSRFTQRFWQQVLPKSKGIVIYPPVDIKRLSSTSSKQNLILSVGRFDSPSHPKRQDVLINAFAALPKDIQTNYKLVLAGGLIGGKKLFNDLKTKASRLNVEFVTNPDFKTLRSLYSKAKIFWHAAGFEIDETKNPDKVEHFGITTIEAMASGCVPMACNKGGQKEIITSGNGFLWNTVPELVDYTLQIIKSPSLLKQTVKKASKRAQDFSLEAFEENIKSVIS